MRRPRPTRMRTDLETAAVNFVLMHYAITNLWGRDASADIRVQRCRRDYLFERFRHGVMSLGELFRSRTA
jgi:hypothetical protein